MEKETKMPTPATDEETYKRLLREQSEKRYHALNTAIESYEKEAWGLIRKLTEERYSNTWDQFTDMKRAGQLAEAILKMREALSLA